MKAMKAERSRKGPDMAVRVSCFVKARRTLNPQCYRITCASPLLVYTSYTKYYTTNPNNFCDLPRKRTRLLSTMTVALRRMCEEDLPRFLLTILGLGGGRRFW